MACLVPLTAITSAVHTVSFYTNVVIDHSLYANASTLDFTWKFTSWWGSNSNLHLGTYQIVTSTVGNNTFTDTVNIVSWPSTNTTTWIGEPFLHTGTIPLPTGFNSSYIPLAVNITYSRLYSDIIGFYVKDAGFLITTPTVIPESATSTTTSTAISSPTQSLPFVTSSKTGAIVGGVIGAIVFSTICMAIGFFLGKRERRKEVNPNNPGNGGVLAGSTEQVMVSLEPNHRPQ
ncbi:hypothetical protein FRC18_005244 [Serendipita sp. 400]|nr:hypothetical protein FRC18_005244 [Serendipita sp. 400]